MVLELMKEEEFDEVFNILENSFSKDEVRPYIYAKKLLSNPLYNIYVKKSENGSIEAFITFWKLSGFDFIEYFAVKKELRGQDIGSSMINAYLEEENAWVILEVEAYDTELAKRRIAFYERLGFIYNDVGYIQPTYKYTHSKVPFKLMSYPKEISKKEFTDIKKEIFKNVYNIK